MGKILMRRSGVEYSHASDAPALPQSVYDDFANAGVSTITLPAGTWYLSQVLELTRSNVTVNASGCLLRLKPLDWTSSSVPLLIDSTSDVSVRYAPSPDGIVPPVRYISKATGVITAAATTLTMDASEVVTLTAGERVIIWAGVNYTDPVEAERQFVMIVSSVNVGTRVVTFTTAFGSDVTNYVDAAGLQAHVGSGLWWKIGDWGTYPNTDNFSKGYGATHGIEKFVGEMVHNVTLNDIAMKIDVVDHAHSPAGMFDIGAVAVDGVTFNNLSIINPHSAGVFLFRAFNTLIDGASFTGTGRALDGATDHEVYAFALWGGDHMTLRNVVVAGTDIGLTLTEAGARGIWFDGLDYQSDFTAYRTGPFTPYVFGFYGTNDTSHVTNARVNATVSSGLNVALTAFNPILFDGYLEFVGSSLVNSFDFGYQQFHTFAGTVIINGVTYGPAVTSTYDWNIIHGASNRNLPLSPVGIYTAFTMEVVTAGDLDFLTDCFGNFYFNADPITTGAPTALVPFNWEVIQAGAPALADYLDQFLNAWQINAGSTSDALVRLAYTYLPAN